MTTTFFTSDDGEDLREKMFYVRTIDKSEFIGELDWGNEEDGTDGLIILNNPVEIIRNVTPDGCTFILSNPLYACDSSQMPIRIDILTFINIMNDEYFDMYLGYISFIAEDEEEQENEKIKKIMSNKVVNIDDLRKNKD